MIFIRDYTKIPREQMEYTSYEPKIPIQRHPKERKPNKLGF